jgi:hypothetical protein
MVLKDSFLIENCPLEQQVFERVQGQFGVPDIACSYIVADGQGRLERTSRIVPDDAKYWPVLGSANGPPIPEYRKHVRTLYLTLGKPLVMAESPRQLLMGVLHGMLGIS